ncbi:condensation domain-containing protein [Streptomyces sp. 8N706]|uniref:condensation domain-containing protein n=1 Tax=Streptomyces sp. 8N706 TaxID=3457416 RepID=UPI003FCFFC2E
MIPLSYAQRRLWFLYQLEGPRPSYNAPLVLRLAGTLDCAALASAISDVVARHESLRTVFPDTDGEPCQHILGIDEARPELRFRDVVSADVEAVLEQEVLYAFDLAHEAPIRATLLRHGPQEHVLLLLMHHIATDGWSNIPLARDLSQAYTARLDGAAPEWEALPVQYADYALWQREALGDEANPESEMSAHLAYWCEELEGAPELLTLPTDRPRPTVPSGDGHRIPFGWDEETQAGLAALAQNTGTTVFMAIQAAVAALLTRLGSGTDIPLGAAFAGRTEEALHHLIGFFTNTVVLRTDTSGNPTFRELVLRVRETNLAAHAHQEMPFERLVEVLKPARSLSYHPLFQVLLTYQNDADLELTFPRIDASVLEIDPGVAQFDLALDFSGQPTADGGTSRMEAGLHYSSDLFDRRSAEAMTDRLVQLLRSAVTDPDQSIGSIEVLSQEERNRILFEWNTNQPQLDTLWSGR